MSGTPGTVSLSSSWPSAARSPARRDARGERLEVVEERPRASSSARRTPCTAASYAVVRLDPVRVALGLAQRLLEVGLEPRRRSIGQAPTSVWKIRYCSTRVGRAVGHVSSAQPRTSGARAPPTPRPSPASAPIRARTSPERFVSCVWVTSRLRGKRSARSALAAWKPATESPKRPGSPPTSLSASSRR